VAIPFSFDVYYSEHYLNTDTRDYCSIQDEEGQDGWEIQFHAIGAKKHKGIACSIQL